MSISKKFTDFELVEKLRNNDIEAFDEIFNRYGNKLYGFTFKYLKSKEDTEGLVQDVFLKIWENRKKLKKESSLKSYILTIAYHNICRIFRKRNIHNKYIEDSKHYKNQRINPEEQLEYRLALKRIDILIEKLPKKQKVIKKYKTQIILLLPVSYNCPG